MDTRLNFTKEALDALPLPEAGKRAVYHDKKVPGLQLRVTSTGAKTFSVFKRAAGGRPERITLGKYDENGRGGISIKNARVLAADAISQLAHGNSPTAVKKEKKVASLTLAEALQEYVDKKRRKDGLPLKERTRDDYLAMVEPGGRVKRDGTLSLDGELYKLAGKPIRELTATEIIKAHEKILERCKAKAKADGKDEAKAGRRAAYCMQVLRATLNWHGIQIEASPFAKSTPGKDRIQIPQAHSSAAPIPPEKIGAWWRAANALPASPGADYLKFCLLTGCRPAEPLQVLVEDCDLAGARVLLRNTKNRRDFTLLLSDQALAIVKREAAHKATKDRLFQTADPRWTIVKLIQTTGVKFSTKNLRSTFASIAEDLVSARTVSHMLNHTLAGDVAGTHYVVRTEAQLRAGWQAVADFIEAAAKEAAQ